MRCVSNGPLVLLLSFVNVIALAVPITHEDHHLGTSIREIAGEKVVTSSGVHGFALSVPQPVPLALGTQENQPVFRRSSEQYPDPPARPGPEHLPGIIEAYDTHSGMRHAIDQTHLVGDVVHSARLVSETVQLVKSYPENVVDQIRYWRKQGKLPMTGGWGKVREFQRFWCR